MAKIKVTTLLKSIEYILHLLTTQISNGKSKWVEKLI